MNIWRQFEEQIKSAAYTNNLGKFVNSLCGRLNADLGRNAEDRQAVSQILTGGNDRALLKLLHEETTLLVLMVRVANQERRDEWELLHSEED